MRNKKTQMEMMGLALIIILISIVMIFVVRFVVLEKPAEHKKEFTESELASNFISTLLKTNTDCRGLTFTEIFQDVAEKYASGPYVSCDNGYTTNTYLPDKLNEILRDTFETWNIAYEFTVETDIGAGIYDSKEYSPNFGEGCTGEKTSKQFALPVGAGGATTLFITLDICS